MTEQDKQALIKHFCERDCGEAAKDCPIMPCHEIELIQEFKTTEPDADTISRAKAIDIIQDYPHGDWNIETMNDMVGKIKQLPPAQPEQLEQCPIYGGMCAYPSDQCYDCPRHAGAKMGVTT